MDHCAGGQPQPGDRGHNKVEVDGQWRILCSFDLSRSILWLRYYQATIVDLETVGTTKMQFFHLAYHQE